MALRGLHTALTMKALKRTLTLSAIDSESYREKLSAVVADANFLHLSEAEAAALYGELTAAMITVQRFVRRWLDERQDSKDAHKVIYRTSTQYAEREPPEEARALARMRRQRVKEHGWHAPLNRKYAQLGAVHTALKRKPDGAVPSREDVRRKGFEKLELVCAGEFRHAVAERFGFCYYETIHQDPSAILVITVESRDGDPDLFVCNKHDRPHLDRPRRWLVGGMMTPYEL